MTQELWPRGHTSSADFDDSEILEECVLHLEQNKMAHLDAIRAARALDSQFDVCDDDDDERGEYGGEADDEAKKKWAASQKRSPSRASSEPLFDVGDIPVYLTDEDQDFQRVRIDEIKDDNMCDSDAVLGSSQLFRAFELHQKWTSEFQRTEGEVSAGTSLPPSPASPKRTIRGAGAAANHNAENDKRHRRRGDPVYDPLAAEHVAKGLEKLPGVVKSMNGVYRHCANEESNEALDADEYWMPSFLDFSVAFAEVKAMVNSGPVKTLAYKRLAVLEQRFSLHVLLNGERELSTQKSVPHRDFYNVRKVDTHVHHSACMNQKHLLRFIKAKLRKNGSEVVTNRDGRDLTLADVFKTLRLTAYDLSIDTLDMHAHDTFHRFDRFNLKYNPAGQSRLREIFLKTDNLIKGRYLAELTREVMSDLEASKYQLAEWRVSIYGRAPSDWAGLADWFFDHALASPNVRWMIQVPRLYAVYRAAGLVKSFDEILQNIFEPLFAVTLDPASNPRLHAFLEAIVGFDSVDDESKPDAGAMDPTRPLPLPKEWTRPEEPPFAYWMYHMYANLRALNRVRAARHLSTFEFRPHAGEAGDIDHLVAAFLVTKKINHGIQLRRSPALQYLYYLAQVGIAMSPLSNNRLFLDFAKNPFPKYFERGLNVSLSTDDPLMLHFTKDPLVEEYSVAAQVWKLSSTDICEIARNSVLQSGWEDRFKKHFIGDNYAKAGAPGNDIRMTNVPDIRITYRHETWQQEVDFVNRHAALHLSRSESAR